MAQLILEIPDPVIPRLRAATIRILDEGDAVDLENPTDLEIVNKLKSLCIQRLTKLVFDFEKFEHKQNFSYTDMSIT
jgi:hypothetical protein